MAVFPFHHSFGSILQCNFYGLLVKALAANHVFIKAESRLASNTPGVKRELMPGGRNECYPVYGTVYLRA